MAFFSGLRFPGDRARIDQMLMSLARREMTPRSNDEGGIEATPEGQLAFVAGDPGPSPDAARAPIAPTIVGAVPPDRSWQRAVGREAMPSLREILGIARDRRFAPSLLASRLANSGAMPAISPNGGIPRPARSGIIDRSATLPGSGVGSGPLSATLPGETPEQAEYRLRLQSALNRGEIPDYPRFQEFARGNARALGLDPEFAARASTPQAVGDAYDAYRRRETNVVVDPRRPATHFGMGSGQPPAEGRPSGATGSAAAGQPEPGGRLDRAQLGSLSRRHEVGDRGPGAISSGQNDRGGASYGNYQLASRYEQPQRFLETDGQRWRAEFRGARPGTAEFNRVWRDIAARDPEAFAAAQHAYIDRTHYDPALRAVRRSTGVDLDARSDVVRDVVWSTSVQHGKAPELLRNAVRSTDRLVTDRSLPRYDEVLINQIYDERVALLTELSRNPERSEGERRQLREIARNRMVEERREALERLRRARATVR